MGRNLSCEGALPRILPRDTRTVTGHGGERWGSGFVFISIDFAEVNKKTIFFRQNSYEQYGDQFSISMSVSDNAGNVSNVVLTRSI
jgi:hypothetical protein